MITAGDMLLTIKKISASYLEEIGSTDGDQEVYIFEFLNNALRKLANIAYVMKISDVKALSADGFVTFQSSAQNITNMYAPLRILDPNGREIAKRTSFVDTKGWWRESANTQIDVKGFSLTSQPLAAGNYTLHYLAYPAAIASTSSPVEFPDAGTMGLCYYTAALIVEAFADSDKNIANHFYQKAKGHLRIAVKANLDGRGHSSSGFVPSMNDIETVFGEDG